MLCGDEEEHAVLLYCWLTGLGLDCTLLLGNGLPEGPRSAYVLVKFTQGSPKLFNPSSGVSYTVKDPMCPLQCIGCAVNSENVWGNIQAAEHPANMNFDLSKAQLWKPFFGRSFPKQNITTIQVNKDSVKSQGFKCKIEFILARITAIHSARYGIGRSATGPNRTSDKRPIHGLAETSNDALEPLCDAENARTFAFIGERVFS